MTPPIDNGLKRVHLFDFDGTLTFRDSLIVFAVHARGRLMTWVVLGLLALPIALSRVGLFGKDSVKVVFFRLLFGGMDESRFESLCSSFAERHAGLIRPAGQRVLRRCVDAGERVVIVSASVDRWIRPFFADLPTLEYLCTEIEVVNGRLTGRFSTPNCNREEKVRRVSELIPDRSGLWLTAYGDSPGDYPLFRYADEYRLRPFHQL